MLHGLLAVLHKQLLAARTLDFSNYSCCTRALRWYGSGHRSPHRSLRTMRYPPLPSQLPLSTLPTTCMTCTRLGDSVRVGVRALRAAGNHLGLHGSPSWPLMGVCGGK